MSARRKAILAAVAAVLCAALLFVYLIGVKSNYDKELADLKAQYESGDTSTALNENLQTSTQERIEVPSGLVAVTVSSSNVLSVGGSLENGSVVNVYASTAEGTSLVGENICILETSTTASTYENSVAWITLAVTPDSVEELIHLSETATLYFALPSRDLVEMSEGDAKEDSSSTSESSEQ